MFEKCCNFCRKNFKFCAVKENSWNRILLKQFWFLSYFLLAYLCQVCRSYHVEVVWYVMENFRYWSLWGCGRNTKFLVACIIEFEWISPAFWSKYPNIGRWFFEILLFTNTQFNNLQSLVFHYCSRVHLLGSFIFKTYYIYSFVLNLRELFNSIFFLAPDMASID